MLTDRYGLSVGTQSAAARDAYAEGVDLLVAACPGSAAAFDRALADDPAFTLAHLAKARSMQLAGNLPAMRESFDQAQTLSGSMSERERSQAEIFRRLFAGQAADALATVRSHMAAWPRDALVLSLAANQSGLIGISGLAGREEDLAEFLGRLAPEYGNDWFFDGHYAMALSEVGRRDEARPRVERSLAQRSLNGYGAHAFAHLCYETGDLNAGIVFLREWLQGYDRAGAMYGHISWHLALFELQAGRVDEGWKLYTDAFSADDHRGAAHQKVVDSVAFLWRSELAGYPRDALRWKKIYDYAVAKFARPGMFLADWHVALAHVAVGDDDGLAKWIAAIEDRVRAGNYASQAIVPTVARAFAAFERGDDATAIELIGAILPERERMGGSRAQVDLVESTLLRACLRAGRLDDARHVLRERRPGPAGLPVAGAAQLH